MGGLELFLSFLKEVHAKDGIIGKLLAFSEKARESNAFAQPRGGLAGGGVDFLVVKDVKVGKKLFSSSSACGKSA